MRTRHILLAVAAGLALADASIVTLALPQLLAGLAKGHIEQGLSRQLELLEQEASS